MYFFLKRKVKKTFYCSPQSKALISPCPNSYQFPTEYAVPLMKRCRFRPPSASSCSSLPTSLYLILFPAPSSPPNGPRKSPIPDIILKSFTQNLKKNKKILLRKSHYLNFVTHIT